MLGAAVLSSLMSSGVGNERSTHAVESRQTGFVYRQPYVPEPVNVREKKPFELVALHVHRDPRCIVVLADSYPDLPFYFLLQLIDGQVGLVPETVEVHERRHAVETPEQCRQFPGHAVARDVAIHRHRRGGDAVVAQRLRQHPLDELHLRRPFHEHPETAHGPPPNRFLVHNRPGE